MRRRSTRGEAGKRVAASYMRSMFAPLHSAEAATAAAADCPMCGGTGGWPGPAVGAWVICRQCAAPEPQPVPPPVPPPPPPKPPQPRPPVPGYPVHRMDRPGQDRGE